MFPLPADIYQPAQMTGQQGRSLLGYGACQQPKRLPDTASSHENPRAACPCTRLVLPWLIFACFFPVVLAAAIAKEREMSGQLQYALQSVVLYIEIISFASLLVFVMRASELQRVHWGVVVNGHYALCDTFIKARLIVRA